MKFLRHSGVLVCLLLVGLSGLGVCDEIVLRCRMTAEGPDKVRRTAEDSASLTWKRWRGASFHATAWKHATRTPDSLMLQAGSHVESDAGPRYHEPDSDGQFVIMPMAQASVKAGQEFTLTEETPFRIAHTLTGMTDFPGKYDDGVAMVSIEPWDAVFLPGRENWGGAGSGAGAVVGVLPPGKYRVKLELLNFPAQSNRNDKKYSRTVAMNARIDFGYLSPAALEWQDEITRFSHRVVRLRGKMNLLDGGMAKQGKSLRLAKENFPKAFDKEFIIRRQSGGGGLMEIVPVNAERHEQFRKAVLGILKSYGMMVSGHRQLTARAEDAVESGDLPGVTLLHLDREIPEMKQKEEREFLRTFSFVYDAPFTVTQADQVRKRHDEARKWMAARMKVLGKDVTRLEQRRDFIVAVMGTAAEELVRQMKADTRLTGREKEILLGGLELAAWTWER